jgi:hypothetical protein
VACTSKYLVWALGWGVWFLDSARGRPGAGNWSHPSIAVQSRSTSHGAEMTTLMLQNAGPFPLLKS